MLRVRKYRKPRRKAGEWYLPTQHPHFDPPVTTRSTAEAIVDNFLHDPTSYRFLPLISFEKRQRRWRYDRVTKRSTASWKSRPLAYCSNRDSQIFSFLALQLSEKYEEALHRHGLQDVVVGYRRGRSNITTARDVFEIIRGMGKCSAVALDIEGFFPSIDHKVLKRNWEKVVGGSLSPSHYVAFRALTKFSQIDRKLCLRRLGLNWRTLPRDLPRPLSPFDVFLKRIREHPKGSLVVANQKPRGIPQGTPLSAIAANISLLEFDIAVADAVAPLNGAYRRYSDDLLILCPTEQVDAVLTLIADKLDTLAGRLSLSSAKTQVAHFEGAAMSPDARELQYLGFLFNGERALLRGSTLSKYYGRMRRAVDWALRCQASETQKKRGKGNRPVLHRKKLMEDLTHLGADSFVRGYATAAAKGLGATSIRRQLRRHVVRLNKMTADRS